MKGAFIHNQVMAKPVAAGLEAKEFPVFREFPARAGQRPPAIDLVSRVHGQLVAFEFERTPTRIANDLAKAQAAGASLLLIVVPHARLAVRIRTLLVRLRLGSTDRVPRVQVLTLGAVLRWIANDCPPPPTPSVNAGGQPAKRSSSSPTERKLP